jgi:hypothetical protein
LTPSEDALTCSWFSSPELAAYPLVWLNPPFGIVMGGLKEWSKTALTWASQGALVAFYGPVFGDLWCDELEAVALTTIRVGGGRVKHPPPPGLKASSPQQHAHRIWLLGSEDMVSSWDHPPRMVWDWRREVFIGPKK